MSLPAGQYLVIPTSTGCRLSWQYEIHTERCIRESCDCVGTSTAKKHGNPYVTVTNYNDGHENFIPSIIMVLSEIFVRFDYDQDGMLNRQELSQFLQLTEGWNSDVIVPDDAFEWFLTTFDNPMSGGANECMGLSLTGFISSQLHAYIEGGRNTGALFRELGMWYVVCGMCWWWLISHLWLLVPLQSSLVTSTLTLTLTLILILILTHLLVRHPWLLLLLL